VILVTGATGFIGRHLVRRLIEHGYPVRVLLRPGGRSLQVFQELPVEVVVAGLNDPAGLRAAMQGSEVVYHLVGGEWHGTYADLAAVDIEGTRAVCRAASESGVGRLFYISHFQADRASAYPVLKAKGIAEEAVRRSGVPYTILRTSLVFGPEDGFTTGIARLLYALPGVFLLPGEGDALIQPLWIGDLTAALTWALDQPQTINQTYEVGGPEHLTFRQVVEAIMERLGARRWLVPTPLPTLRALTVFLESTFPGLPVSVYWLDYLAVNRVAALDVLPRTFGVLPTTLRQGLDHLDGRFWWWELWRSLLRRG